MAEIVIVDDEKVLVNSLRVGLSKKGHSVHPFYAAQTFLEFIQGKEPDIIFLDLKLPDLNGLDVLHTIERLGKHIPTIIITAHGDIRSAVLCMKAGAYDYLSKPFELAEIEIVIEKVLNETRLIKEVEHLRQRSHNMVGLDSIIGQSLPMQALKQTIAKLQGIDTITILIRGESGTGKNLVAKAIHNLSSRNKAQFIEVDCAALPGTLIESELFGHEKGAFTDAKQRKTGLLEIADGGTLFLDEIGELPLSLQAKLLKFIEGKSFRRIGGTLEILVDALIITSTNRDLDRAIFEQSFRQDLYYRLNVFPIEVPPLRDRGEDILELARHYLKGCCRQFNKPPIALSAGAEETFMKYNWPGNVRELRNLIERLVILSSGRTVTAGHLPAEMHCRAPERPHHWDSHDCGQRNIDDIIAEIERDLVCDALQRAHGVQTEAARRLFISRYALIRKMKRLHIDEAV